MAFTTKDIVPIIKRHLVVWLHSVWFAYVSKVLLASLFIWFLYLHIDAYQVFRSPVYLLYATMEAIVVLLVLSRKMPSARTVSAWAISAALYGTFVSLMLQPNGTAVAPHVSVVLSVLGVIISIGGYLSLNSSFGITPAIRGVKVNGLYAFVRHPIYLGYIPMHLRYLLANMSYVNIGMLATIWIAMGLRIHFEEAWLMRDDQYRAYVQKVRYRLLPGVY